MVGVQNSSNEELDLDRDSAHDAFTPIFRAIKTPSQRRGIRLESIYWDSLKMIADSERISLGESVEHAAEEAADVGNLASILRVHVARWFTDRVQKLETLTRLESISPLVHASPTPTFVITADKRIVLFNRPFLSLIKSKFPNARSDIVYMGLRLSIDVQIEKVIERLKSGDGSVLSTGFAIGVEGRRLRGQLNFVLAPIHKQAMVIAYISDINDGSL